MSDALNNEGERFGVARWGGAVALATMVGVAGVAIGQAGGASSSPVKAAPLATVQASFSQPAASQKAPTGAAATPAPSCPLEAIGALGVVEPAGRAHRVGAPGEGVVARVAIAAGDFVSEGQVLFTMDDRTALAAVRFRERALELAEARAKALGAEFRRKQQAVRAAEAALSAAKAAEADADDLAGIAERLKEGSALSGRERTHRRFAAVRARAAVAEAEARRAEVVAERNALDPAGPGARVEVARAEVAQEKARLEATVIDAERLQVRAPVAGRVLAVSVRPGERVERGAAAPVLLAPEGALRLRVEVDALDLGRFSEQGEATASRRGDVGAERFRLRFVRLEPMVEAKSQFADALNDVMDRRVAIAIFETQGGASRKHPLKIGELLEVRIAPDCGKAEQAERLVDASR